MANQSKLNCDVNSSIQQTLETIRFNNAYADYITTYQLATECEVTLDLMVGRITDPKRHEKSAEQLHSEILKLVHKSLGNDFTSYDQVTVVTDLVIKSNLTFIGRALYPYLVKCIPDTRVHDRLYIIHDHPTTFEHAVIGLILINRVFDRATMPKAILF